MLKKYNYGLCIGRFQPMHFGHMQLISRMIDECNYPIIAIGSPQESRTYGNPFTYAERKRMLLNVYGDKLRHVYPLRDIFNTKKWARYALDSIEKKIHNKIQVYYCGNDQDACFFMAEGIKVCINDRDISYYKGLSASMIRNMITTDNESWKDKTPAMNHRIIKKVYGI